MRRSRFLLEALGPPPSRSCSPGRGPPGRWPRRRGSCARSRSWASSNSSGSRECPVSDGSQVLGLLTVAGTTHSPGLGRGCLAWGCSPQGGSPPTIPVRHRPYAPVPRRSGARFCDCSRGAELTEPDTSVLSAEHTIQVEGRNERPAHLRDVTDCVHDCGPRKDLDANAESGAASGCIV